MNDGTWIYDLRSERDALKARVAKLEDKLALIEDWGNRTNQTALKLEARADAAEKRAEQAEARMADGERRLAAEMTLRKLDRGAALAAEKRAEHLEFEARLNARVLRQWMERAEQVEQLLAAVKRRADELDRALSDSIEAGKRYAEERDEARAEAANAQAGYAACRECGHGSGEHGHSGCHTINCDCTRFAGRAPEARCGSCAPEFGCFDGSRPCVKPDAPPSPDVRDMANALQEQAIENPADVSRREFLAPSSQVMTRTPENDTMQTIDQKLHAIIELLLAANIIESPDEDVATKVKHLVEVAKAQDGLLDEVNKLRAAVANKDMLLQREKGELLTELKKLHEDTRRRHAAWCGCDKHCGPEARRDELIQRMERTS